ncbi:MAG TPA: hypothetical protein VK731_09510 [Candidatus Cybelea sp.]|nr:hypothetical protein [Candidatus Cybelea sp.]
MKRFFAVLMACLALDASAGDITPGITLTDGQRLTAAQLAQLVSQAIINASFYTSKVSQTNLTPTDILLVYSAASGTFHQLSGNAAVFQNNALVNNQVPYAAGQITTNSFFLGYDSTNFVLFKASLTNLATALSPWIVPGLLNLSNTLSAYPAAQPNPYYITNAVQLIVFDTNGVPYSLSLSNLFAGASGQLNTNGFAFVNAQVFAPQTVTGTNTYGFTNAWGTQSAFPITNLFIPSITNAPTLSATDSIPIMSGPQQTNTTASLNSIFQWMTNQNAFPPYTYARCQFSGIPLSMSVSNVTSTVNGTICIMTNPASGWGTNFFATNQIYAVSFITNGVSLFGGMQTNLAYYIVCVATNNGIGGNWAHVFSNYVSAATYLQNGSSTNYIAITGSGGAQTANVMLYLTNFTGFNADAVQVTTPAAPNTVRTGVYDVWFRTPAASALYYMTASSIQQLSGPNPLIVNIADDDLITTNRIRATVQRGSDESFIQSPLVHVLISPQ